MRSCLRSPWKSSQHINSKAGLVGDKKVVEQVLNPRTEQTAQFGCVLDTLTVFFKY